MDEAGIFISRSYKIVLLDFFLIFYFFEFFERRGGGWVVWGITLLLEFWCLVIPQFGDHCMVLIVLGLDDLFLLLVFVSLVSTMCALYKDLRKLLCVIFSCLFLNKFKW